VAFQGEDEGILLQRVQAHVGHGDHSGGARKVLNERDLAEAFAPAERRHVLVAFGDAAAAIGDSVEAVAGLALADERRAGGRLHRDQGTRQTLKLRCRQRAEDGDGAQQLDLDLRHVGRGVDGAQAPPSQGDEHEEQVRDALVAGSGLSFVDLGEHELKGAPGSFRLYAVE